MVTVIATGIDSEKHAKKARTPQRSAFSAPAGRSEGAASVERRTPAPERKEEKNLFGDWDIRRETSVRDIEPARHTEQYPTYQDNTAYEQEATTEDDGLDTPPFFRKRRK